jgi:hypothetical protein
LAVVGGLVVLASFMLDFPTILRQGTPPPFRWRLFAVGMGFGIAAVALGVSRIGRNLPTSGR